jgi:hypothetical protein
VKRLIAPLESAELLRGLPGVLDFSRSGREAAVVVENIDAARPGIDAAGIAVREIDLNLDEIFEAYVIGRPKEGQNVEPPLERVA